MLVVIGLLLMLLEVCHGVETCDCRQDGAQCYGALGGTVGLQLMGKASEIFKFQLKQKNNTSFEKVILHWRNKTIVSNAIEDRSSFTPFNGTFRINKLNRTDGGEYTLEIFDSNGRRSELRTLKLTIQAPVSSVLLLSECLSQGEMRVSCSSEGGDSPQYSWTLDGHTLTDAQLLSGNNESNNITLKQDVSGQLVCSVRNNVSSVSKDKKISTCGFIFINCTINGTHISKWVFEANNTLCTEPTTPPPTMITDTTAGKKTDTVSLKPPTYFTSSNQTVRVPSSDDPWYTIKGILPIIAGVLSALLILLVVGVAVVCAHKKQENNKPKEEEDEQELTYADVRVVQRPGRQKQQKEEVEVEYGQVKISQQPRQTVEPAGDECVYAKVRRGR